MLHNDLSSRRSTFAIKSRLIFIATIKTIPNKGFVLQYLIYIYIKNASLLLCGAWCHLSSKNEKKKKEKEKVALNEQDERASSANSPDAEYAQRQRTTHRVAASLTVTILSGL